MVPARARDKEKAAAKCSGDVPVAGCFAGPPPGTAALHRTGGLRRKTEGVGLASLCSTCLRLELRSHPTDRFQAGCAGKRRGWDCLRSAQPVSGSNCVLIPPTGFKPAAPENGGGGIRTHGDSRLFGFQDRRNKPLCHPSSSQRCKIIGRPRGCPSCGANPATFRGSIGPKKNRRPESGRRL